MAISLSHLGTGAPGGKCRPHRHRSPKLACAKESQLPSDRKLQLPRNTEPLLPNNTVSLQPSSTVDALLDPELVIPVNVRSVPALRAPDAKFVLEAVPGMGVPADVLSIPPLKTRRICFGNSSADTDSSLLYQ